MDYERWKYFRQATNGVGLTATISNNRFHFYNFNKNNDLKIFFIY